MYKSITTRTKEQRQNEVRTIIKKLNELHLNTGYDAIKTLFENMKTYINDDIKIDIDIPFPDMNVNIKGVLETDIKKKVWVKLTAF
uniref:Uncharacterized protein n=1 Tax=viral metagenome TaxID=1070528 RepID=A0A6C0EXJ4_9ZZZZ